MSNLALVDRAAAIESPARRGKINPRKLSKAERATRRQAWGAVGIGAVAVTLTGLSLSHLTHGIEIASQGAPGDWKSVAMACGIDLAFISLEIAKVTVATDKLRKVIARFADPAIYGTLIGSAAMNAFAFAEGADWSTWQGQVRIGAALSLGLAIPGLIYCLTRAGAEIYLDAQKRKA